MTPILGLALALTPEPVAQVPAGCLPGPRWEDLTDEAGILESEGLSRDAVVLALDGVYPDLRRCVPADRSLRAAVTADLEVACDGRVERVALGDSLPVDLSDCLAAAIRGARFPPHALPDGFAFQYVMELDFTAGR